MRRTITISLLFSLMAISGQSVRGEVLPSKDGAEASLTDVGGNTTYYSLLTEAWDAAQGKTVTVTMLKNVNLGEEHLEINDKSTDILLTKLPESLDSSRKTLRSQNAESVITINAGSLMVKSDSEDLYLDNDGASGVGVYVNGEGELIVDNIRIFSSRSYGIIQMSKKPVVINSGRVYGGSNYGIKHPSLFANTEGCKFILKGGIFSGVANNVGAIKDWLYEGKAFYDSDGIHVGYESSATESLTIKDCEHYYDDAVWTYESSVASCKCSVCGYVMTVDKPAAKVEYEEKGKTIAYYTAELDKNVADKVNGKSVTITLLRNATIATDDKVFYIRGKATYIGGEYCLKGTISGTEVVIESGTYNSGSNENAVDVYNNATKFHIKGGTFWGSKHAVSAFGPTTIDGGTFTSGSGGEAAVYANRSLVVNGGTFCSEAAGQPGLLVGYYDIVLNGGSFPVKVTSDGSYYGGVDFYYTYPKAFLGEGKAYYVDNECTKYYIRNITESLRHDIVKDFSLYVGDCKQHLYLGDNKPTKDVECSHCNAKISPDDIVAKCTVTLLKGGSVIDVSSYFVTDIDACLGYYVPESSVETHTEITLLKDAASDEAHSLDYKAKEIIKGGDCKITNSTKGKSYFLQAEDGSSIEIDGGTFESIGDHDLIYVKNGGSLLIDGGKYLTKDACYSVKAEATADVKLKNGEFQHGIYSAEQTLNKWLSGDAFYYIYEGDGVGSALKKKTDGAELTSIGDYTVISLCPGHQWSEWEISEKTKDGTSIEITEKQTCSVCGLEQTRKRYEENCDHKKGVDWTGNTSGRCPICDEPLSLDINADNADGEILIGTDEAHVYNSLTFTRNYKTPNIFYSFCVPFDTKVKDWKDGGEAVYTFYDIYNIVQYDNDNDGELDEMRIVVNVLHDDDEVKANTPYFVKLKKGGVQTTTFTAVSVGATSEPIEPLWCASTKSYYRFYCSYASVGNLNDGKTYNVNDGKYNRITKAATKITPTRWYMQIDDRESTDGVSEAKAISIYVLDEDDEMTEIKEVNSTAGDSRIYNINGMRLSAPERGRINIINGKKIFVK